ncbi:hypothetical protein C8Q76DRAFT_796001 [Earliella scabrosa]|nr:hypothetical protein C8Q76DRAFT_796001 [Earliella scabrosa]
MSSAPLTYLYRVRKLFSELAKAGQSSIQLEALIVRIRDDPSRVRPPSPHHRRFTIRAVTRESRARRVKVDRSSGAQVCEFTATGMHFYREWGVTILYLPHDPRLKRMTVVEVRKQSTALRKILSSLAELFMAFYPHEQLVGRAQFYSAILVKVFAVQDGLQDENTHLHACINDARSAERRLRRALAASTT